MSIEEIRNRHDEFHDQCLVGIEHGCDLSFTPEAMAMFLRDANADRAELLRVVDAVEGLVGVIPTNWLDSLLTGNESPLNGHESYTPKHIELLLLALKTRLQDKIDAILRGEEA